MKKATLYEAGKNNAVRCTACSWYCRIGEGRVGVCGTRMNRGGTLYSLVYGKTTGLSVDPVEKKPLHHFLPGSRILSFGTPGCNFGCEFCQNAWMSQVGKFPISNIKYQISNNLDEIHRLTVAYSPKEIVEEALRENCQGIAYTYNEPSIFAEFAHDTAKLARKKKLKNIFVSNGYESSETFEYMKPYLDAINIDLKSFRNDFYLKVCKATIEPVKENIRRFFDSGIITEVTTLVIPGENDSDEELHDIAGFLAMLSPDIPWHISAFHPAYKMADALPTPHKTLVKAYDIGKRAGLHYIYVGNVNDTMRSATYCPNCGKALIKRIGYDVLVTGIKNNACVNCTEYIYGAWQ